MVLFRLLGPVELLIDGAAVPIGPPQRRAVLAALLYDTGLPVPPPTLIGRVWGAAPPPAAPAALHSHLARLRRLLHEVADRTGVPVALERRGGGYALAVEPAHVDLLRFRRLTDRADEPALVRSQRVAALREALDLWGPAALTGVPGAWADHVRQVLAGRRLTVLLRWARLELDAGRPDIVVDELTAAVADNPVAEALVAVLMQALRLAGRDAEALACYATVRRHIADALGSEPGPELRSLHEALLRGEQPAVARGAPGGQVVPAQLPADVPDFTGRAAELRILDDLVAAGTPGPATAVCAVSGTPGVGKTALVVHWAHRVVGEFPDGQLFVDLRGHDDDQPVPTGQALALFLRALGVPGAAVPADVEERAALYRSIVANRRLLVVLDNAAGYDQVRLLLPGGATCVAVVTGRDRIPALGVRHGARRVEVDLLSPVESVGLLGRLVADRVDADPAGAAALAERCAQLPLALRIAADYLAEHPGVAVSALTAELDDTNRLDLLDAGGESRTAVRAVFASSYRRLPGPTARAFRLLALPPTADVDRYAAAALLDTDLHRTGRLLDELRRAHLVRADASGRFSMHDLLRAYARERAEAEDGADRHAACVRLLEHHLALAALAMDVAVPHERHRRPTVPPPNGPAPDLSDPKVALTWLDANRAALVASVTGAVAQGRPDIAVDLATVLRRYLDNGAHHTEALQVHTCAVAAAAGTGDRRGEGNARRHLAIVRGRFGDLTGAVEEAERALQILRVHGGPGDEGWVVLSLGTYAWEQDDYVTAYGYEARAYEMLTDAGDRAGAAVAVDNLAGLLARWGRYDEALVRAGQALASFEDLGDRSGVARTLGNIGEVYERLGRYEEAAAHYRRSLEVFEEVGNRLFIGRVMGAVASVEQRLGRFDEAFRNGSRALAAVREAGDREGEIDVLNGLGTAYLRAGDLDAAISHHSRALDLALSAGDRSSSGTTLVNVADVLIEAGRVDEALSRAGSALAIARDLADRYVEGRALDAIARVAQAGGETGTARGHWLAAMDAYAALGVPEADAVRARLARSEGARDDGATGDGGAALHR